MLGTVGGAHINVLVTDKQIGALDQLHAHLAGEEGMFEVGAVKQPRRQHHHARVIHRAGGLQRRQQQARVVIDGRNALGREQLGEQTHHHLAVFQHVADAAGRAQVVFEHVIGAVAVAHQVDSGDVRIQVTVQIQTLHGDLVALVGQHLLGGNDSGLDDPLVVIEVGEEHVQRLDPLNTATLDNAPLASGNAARNDVEGDQSLGALLVTVEREGDAGTVKQQVGFAPPLSQLFRRGGR